MKKYMYLLIAVILILIVVFLIHKKNKERLFSEKFKDFHFLSSNLVKSENYEVIKICDNWQGSAEVNGIINLHTIYNDTKNNNIILQTAIKGYEKVNNKVQMRIPCTLFWKIDYEGRFIDSIKTDYSVKLDNSGAIIYEDKSYINWINDGDKTKKKFDVNFSLKETEKRFIKVKSAESETYSLETEYFKKVTKQSTSLGDFNSNGRSGWNGIGYFKLKHNSNLIEFKGHAFNGILDRFQMFYPIKKNTDIAILYLTKRASDARPFQNSGVYIIRKKIKTSYFMFLGV